MTFPFLEELLSIFNQMLSIRAFGRRAHCWQMPRSHYRAIRYKRHDCPFVADRTISLKFKVLIRSEADRYILIRFGALGCDMITIAQFLMTRSGLYFRYMYDHIRLDRIVPIKATIGIKPVTISTIEVPDSGRCGTRIYVLMRSSRTDTLNCDRIGLWSRCLSRSPSRIPTISARVYIQPD